MHKIDLVTLPMLFSLREGTCCTLQVFDLKSLIVNRVG